MSKRQSSRTNNAAAETMGDAGLSAAPDTGAATPGHPQDASDLYELYAGRVHAFCVDRLGDREEAADAVQDTFIKAWIALRDGCAVRRPLPWLLTIAGNVCVSRHRARTCRPDATPLQDEGHAALSPPPLDELASLPTALRALPEGQRRAFVLRELLGCSYEEIGRSLGVSYGSVAALLHRSRRALSASIGRAPRRGMLLVPAPEALESVLEGGAATVAATAAGAVVMIAPHLEGDPPELRPTRPAPAPPQLAPAPAPPPGTPAVEIARVSPSPRQRLAVTLASPARAVPTPVAASSATAASGVGGTHAVDQGGERSREAPTNDPPQQFAGAPPPAADPGVAAATAPADTLDSRGPATPAVSEGTEPPGEVVTSAPTDDVGSDVRIPATLAVSTASRAVQPGEPGLGESSDLGDPGDHGEALTGPPGDPGAQARGPSSQAPADPGVPAAVPPRAPGEHGNGPPDARGAEEHGPPPEARGGSGPPAEPGAPAGTSQGRPGEADAPGGAPPEGARAGGADPPPQASADPGPRAEPSAQPKARAK